MKKIISLLFIISAMQTAAQQNNTAAAMYRQFDFWLGTWDVYKYGTDVLAGKSYIEPIIDSVGILENYVSVQGSEGKSLNKYNPAKKRWEQYWIDNSGLTLFMTGGLINGKMILDDAANGDGKSINQIVWEKTANGTVRQTWNVSKDGGKTWAVSFDGEYKHALSLSHEELLRMDWANLAKYAPDNQVIKETRANEKRVVFMGNSITEGWKAIDNSFFEDKPYIDRGISGQTTPQMLIRFRPDVIDLKPAVVVILAGINDIAENTGPISLEHVFGNIVSMAELARASNIKVVLSSVLPAYDFPWKPNMQPAEKVISLNTMIRNYCMENNIVYVDYFSAMVDERNGLDKRYTEDGVHPTLAGYEVMNPLVERAIREALSRKK